LAKKRGDVKELHGKPRKLNPEAPVRVGIVLPRDLVAKLKMQAFDAGVTLQKHASEILKKHLEK
jgi:hypothetical protein